MGGFISTVAFPFPDKEAARKELEDANLIWLTLKSQEASVLSSSSSNPQVVKVPAFHIRRPHRRDTKKHLTVICSHGNAEDISLNLPFYESLSMAADCDVLAYEYPGYSISDGEPSEQGCYDAIDAALLHLTDECGLPLSQIALFGRSIGTGPTVDLASRTKGLAGVVLVSPLSSGARAVIGHWASLVGYPLDIFKSYTKVDKISCPVFIMHGTVDEVVPCSNGRELYDIMKAAGVPLYEPYWPNYGHNNIPTREMVNRSAIFFKSLTVA